MIPLSITTNLELDPWTDLQREDIIPGTIERIGILPNGTQQQRACVELLIRLPDGRTVIAETTLRLFNVAARAVAATPVAQMEEL
jgi:hypothetical protein